MKKIVTLTLNPALDKTTSVENLVPEKKLRCAQPISEPGGGGVNVSRAIHKLGGTSSAFICLGGPLGSHYEKLLQNQEIQFHSIPIEGDTRENLIVVESATGQQFRFGMPGPEILVHEQALILTMLEPALADADYLVASGSLAPGLPPDFYAHIAKLARKQNCRLVLDTSGPALQQAAKAGAFLLKPNLNELSFLAGVEELKMDEVENAARELIRKGYCEVMVVSLGPVGAMLVTKDQGVQVQAPVVKRRSTVGAGDSMVAGITLSLSRGLSFAEVLAFGVACGTAATMNPGTELCRKKDVDRLFQWLKMKYV